MIFNAHTATCIALTTLVHLSTTSGQFVTLKDGFDVADSYRGLRNLDEIHCDEPYMVMSSEEIKSTLTQQLSYFASTYGIEEATSIIEDRIPLLTYDVQFMKVCASCKSQSLSGYGCEESDYGYDVTHSGLVLLPVDHNATTQTTSIIDAEHLKPWFQFRAVTVAPIDSFNHIYEPPSLVLAFALMAASSGYVAISPENTGYGESNSLVPSPLDRKSLVTGTMPLFSKASKYVDDATDGRTKLSKKDASFMGYSGGGFHAVAAADALKKYGFIPVQVLAGGAPLKSRTWTLLGFIRDKLKFGPFDGLNMALVGLAVSNTRPGASNFGTPSQSFLIPEKVFDDGNGLLDLFQDRNAPSSQLNSTVYLDYVAATYPGLLAAEKLGYINPTLVTFIEEALENEDHDPCRNVPDLATKGLDLICDALDASDLTNVMDNANYPVTLCHSTGDTLVTIENTYGFDVKYLLPGLSHGQAYVPCHFKLFNNAVVEEPVFRKTKAPKGMKKEKNSKEPKGDKGPKGDKKSKRDKSPKA